MANQGLWLALQVFSGCFVTSKCWLCDGTLVFRPRVSAVFLPGTSSQYWGLWSHSSLKNSLISGKQHDSCWLALFLCSNKPETFSEKLLSVLLLPTCSTEQSKSVLLVFTAGMLIPQSVLACILPLKWQHLSAKIRLIVSTGEVRYFFQTFHHYATRFEGCW